MSTNVCTVPSGLCCRVMASNADLEAVTQASSGPYRLRTCGPPSQRLAADCHDEWVDVISGPDGSCTRELTCSLTRSICAFLSSVMRVL